MAEVGSLSGTAENLTNLWRARICKISRQKCRICKFLRQNFVFVIFRNKNVTFSNTQYPKIPDYSENISGRVRVMLKIIGSGRVSGTRLTLEVTQSNASLMLKQSHISNIQFCNSKGINQVGFFDLQMKIRRSQD